MNRIFPILAAIFFAFPAHAEILQYSPVSTTGGGFTPGTDVSGGVATTSGATASRTLAQHFADHYNVKDWGARCDGTILIDVTTTSGSPIITSASYVFTQADVGKKVYLTSQSTDNALLSAEATIASFSGGSATLSANATGTKTAPNYARLTMYTTDDTTAINAAISALSPICASNCVKSTGTGNYGAYLDFPAGVCVASSLVVDRQVILEGQGRQNTILFQKGGTNANFVTSENFSSLTGTGLNYGPSGTFNGVVSSPLVPSQYGLKDIHVDGNRGYQTTGDCVDFYGNAQIWQRTYVEDCYGNGQWTEASSAFSYSATDWRAQEEGFMDDMIVRNTGVDGWVMAGPHDSQVTSYVAYGWGYSGSGYGFDQKAVSGASGGAHFGTIHPYTSNGSPTDLYIGNSSDFQLIYSDFGTTTIAGTGNRINSVFLLSCGDVAAATPCLDIQQSGNIINQIYGEWYFGTLPTNLTMVQLESAAASTTINAMYGSSITSTVSGNTLLNVQSSFNNITASLNNMTGTGNVCATIGGTYNHITLNGFGCTTFLNYTGSGHNNLNLGYYVGTGQTAITGTFAATDVVTKTDSNATDYLNAEAGTVTQPALTFGGDLLSGLYHPAAGKLGLSAAGTETGEWSSAGLSMKSGTISFGSNIYGAPFDVENAVSPAALFINSNTSQGIGEQIVIGSDPGAAATSGARMALIAFKDAIDNNHDLYIGAAISAYTSQAWTSGAAGSSINLETIHNNASSRTIDLTVGNGAVTIPAFATAGVISNNSGGMLATNPAVNIAGGAIQLGAVGSSLGELTLNGNTSGTVNIIPAAAAGSWTMTLPTSAGTNGYVLQTNGAGVTTWAANSASNQGVTYVSGNYYGNQPRSGATGVIPTAGSLVAAPFYVYSTNTFTAIGMEVSAIGSGATAFMCVYDSTGANNGPGALVAGGSTTSSSIAAVGDFVQSLASPVVLNAGLYYLASEFTATTTLPTMYLVGSIAPEAKWMPQPTIYANTGIGTGTANTGYSLTNTYASGCPSIFGTPTGKVTSLYTPVMNLKAQ
jgi:hypothetical protein